MIETTILELQNFCVDPISSDDIDLIKSYQVEFYDGFIDIILKEVKNLGIYEVYVSLKSKSSIASALLYKNFNNLEEAKKYYNINKNFIENNSEKNIVNHCKTREK